MDPEQDPYTPDAGTRPPALVGRDKVLKEFTMIYRRAMNGRSDKALVMVGLRGVGKTVLLNEFKSISNSEATVLISIEIPTEDGKFLSLFAEKCRQALFQISERDRWTARALAATRTLASFSLTFEPSGAVSVKLGVDRAEGKADSGELDSDLGDLICSLGEAARDHGKILLILIDEMQNLSTRELIAIVTAKHQINQGTLPVLLVGAGMPNMPALIGAAPKYSERMFSFPPIAKLDPLVAGLALTEPANALSVEIEEDAVKYIVQYTEGYPFFAGVWKSGMGSSTKIPHHTPGRSDCAGGS